MMPHDLNPMTFRYNADDILNLKRCTKCILPETYPNIWFNEQGICNYCLNHTDHYYPGHEALHRELETYRNNKGEKYDCLVGLSGGKDSTYTLYQIVTVHKMRPLAFHFDNGTTGEAAKVNVNNTVKKLHVDLITVKSKNSQREKVFRNNFNAWCREPRVEMIPMWCVGCNEGYRLGAFRLSKKLKIPLYIAGSSAIEGASFKRDLIKGRNLYLNYIYKLLRNPLYLKPNLLATTIKDHLLRARPFWVDYYYRYNVKRISYFSWVKYDEKKVLNTVKNELGWTSDIDTSTSRIDCIVGILRDYLYDRMLGFTEDDVKHSNMIRQGMLLRSEGMVRVEKRLTGVEDDINYVISYMKNIGIN